VGRVSLVTAAASGMGRAIALAFADAGAAVLLADVDVMLDQAAAPQACDAGGRARFVALPSPTPKTWKGPSLPPSESSVVCTSP
jgi:NAD(P)-dependent dehydrogenase (short-subunit alcohol dehydrogenase family)